MTKIAIISQPEQGVLIDVGGCTTLQEATQHLTYTLQVSSQFWEEQPVDLNLGTLSISRDELAQVFTTLGEVGVRPRQIFAQAATTKAALRAFNLTPAAGQPASLPLAPTAPEAPLDMQPDFAPPQLPPEPAAPPQAAVERETVPVEVEGTICGAISEAPPAAQCQPAAETACPPSSAAGEPPPADGAAVPAQEQSGVIDASPEAPKEPAKPAAPHVMYLRQTLRSGQAISHRGHLVIVGDVNPGAEVIAEGDITIWGALRGIAHAGVGGNIQAEIRALSFDPIQLRIANAIARSPDRPKGGQRSNGPETARIVSGTIRISSSAPN